MATKSETAPCKLKYYVENWMKISCTNVENWMKMSSTYFYTFDSTKYKRYATTSLTSEIWPFKENSVKGKCGCYTSGTTVAQWHRVDGSCQL